MPYNSTYVATVATIIPVIFVALAVDLRTLKPRAGDSRHAVLLLSIVAALVVAEAVCLSSLAQKSPLRGWEHFLIGGAFMWSAMLILVSVVTPIYDVIKVSLSGQIMWRLITLEALSLFMLAAVRVVTLKTAVIVPTMTLIVASFGAAGTNETLQPLAQKLLRRLLPHAVADELLCAIEATNETTGRNLCRRMQLSEGELNHRIRRGMFFGYIRRTLDGTVDNGEDMERWRLTTAGKVRVAEMVSHAEQP